MISLPFRSRVSAIATLLFFIATLVVGGLIFDRQQELQKRVLDTVTWMLYQFDRSVRDARIALLETPVDSLAGELDGLVLRYDILYGRSQMLLQGQTRQFMERNGHDLMLVHQSIDLIEGLDPLFSALAEGSQAFDDAARQRVATGLVEAQALSRRMLGEHNALASQLRTSDTQALLRMYGVVLLCIVLIMITGTILVMALRREARAHRLKAELLQVQSRALRHAVTRAESASQAKSDVMAIMSHEICTPLNGVIGMADLLRDEALSEAGKRHVASLEQSAGGLRSVISDVLDYSRIEAGQMVIERAVFSLAQMLDHLALSYQTRPGNGVTFLLRFSTQLPDFVEGDVHRLRQVLMNLLDNAFKFTAQGFVMLRVMRVDDRRIGFVVYDTGCGIDAQDLNAIFEPFAQPDATSVRRHEGTGLGLAICRSVIRAMGGELAVDSQRGTGSRFWFDIPLRVGEGVTPAASQTPAIDRALRLDPHHVLVVEDNALNRELIAVMLSRLGQSCEVVEDGQQALAALARRPFDLMLIDLQMPVMDGLETVRRWREYEGQCRLAGEDLRPLPIVAVTANGMAEHRRACLAAGMDDLIGKPFTRRELHRVLSGVPSRSRRPPVGAEAAAVRSSSRPTLGDADASPFEGEVDAQLLSSAVLDELRSVMSVDALARLVTGYLLRFPARIARLRAAMDEGDRLMLALQGDELANASLALGASGVARDASELALAAVDEPVECLKRRIDTLEGLGIRTGGAWRACKVVGEAG
ncbi:ATP-binding protein [Halomonas sp. V046]|uniref:ATP-binding protein n=1 Tax=Halomonas sp. V046 TaxID=3459611 RepID=UPI004044DE44